MWLQAAALVTLLVLPLGETSSPDVRSTDQRLLDAAREDDTAKVRKLIMRGADVSATDRANRYLPDVRFAGTLSRPTSST